MIQNIKGTKDLLPEVIGKWQYIQDVFKKISEQYNYQEIRTPIFEKTEVFSRSIGEATDIVNKEMYTFLDKSDESITLRPELTASIARAVLQHSLLQQSPNLRFWYFGPFFRYEQPQKGRMRQFHQYGAECIGSQFPESDAEIIMLASRIFLSLGINDFKLIINSLGNSESRTKYREALIEFLKDNEQKLSKESQIRLQINPLRILDSKAENDIEILNNAPNILEFLDPESKEHFEQVLSILDSQNLKYEINPKLVRGLDYYSHTVFEFQSSVLGSQNSIGGGGRYNKLFNELGGSEIPAVGLALGVERIILIMEEKGLFPNLEQRTDLYLVSLNKATQQYVIKLAEQLRGNGMIVAIDLLRRSVKAQMREANKMNAKYVIVIGEDEIKSNLLTIKDMTNGEQTQYSLTGIADFFKNK